eukprot:EG_transcript_12493
MSDFLGPAVEHAIAAAGHDERKEYSKAYDEYLTAVEYYMKAIKYEKEEKKRAMMNKKCHELVDRAERIKEFLKPDGTKPPAPSPAPGPQPPGGAAPGTVSNKKVNKKDDEETAKFRGNLEGAIVKETPNVRWDDVAGLQVAKDALREAVILPLQYPQLFLGNRRPWKGILLYGPPGTGKSYLAKAVATESSATFFSISSSDLLSKWLGESEKLVRNLFEMARESAPSIVFIDEIDSLCSARGEGDSDATRRVKTEFLVQMQGVGHGNEEQVLVLAATNIPWNLDSGIRRRFERRIYIPLPDPEARALMFKLHLGDTPHELRETDFLELGELTEGFSGSDISVLTRDALMEPVRTIQLATHFKRVAGPLPGNPAVVVNDLYVACSPGDPAGFEMTAYQIQEPEKLVPLSVTKVDFLKALQRTRPSVSWDDIKRHVEWTEEFGQEC